MIQFGQLSKAAREKMQEKHSKRSAQLVRIWTEDIRGGCDMISSSNNLRDFRSIPFE